MTQPNQPDPTDLDALRDLAEGTLYDGDHDRAGPGYYLVMTAVAEIVRLREQLSAASRWEWSMRP